MKITAELLRIGQKNLNGRIYTRETAEEIVDQFKRKVAEQGHLFGQIGHPENLQVSLANVSHNVNDIRIENNRIVGDITVMDTPSGKVLKSLVEIGMKDYQGILVEIVNPHGGPMVFRPRSIGTVNDDGTVELQELISFDAVPADEDAFKGLLDGETQYTRKWIAK